MGGSDLSGLVATMRAGALERSRTLPAQECVDLVSAFAVPWSRDLAFAFAGRSLAAGAGALELSRAVFAQAAHATNRGQTLESSDAMRELAEAFGTRASPLALQGFVALAHTLPLLLAGAWHVLALQPSAWDGLCSGAVPRAAAIDELLRLASPARWVFRRVLSHARIGTRELHAGDEVILAIGAANRCSIQFENADSFIPARVNLSRSGERHLGLGHPPHACAGGALVRTALETATWALLNEFVAMEPAGPVTWLGGFAIDGPTSLPVVLTRRGHGNALGDACRG